MAYKRKISGINYSLSITLPKEWAKKIGLQRGHIVDCVMQEDGSLSIRRSNGDEKSD